MSDGREKALEEWAASVTLDEAMAMGVVRALEDLAWEMEKYLSQGPPEYRLGTRFWLEQVRETIALYDSTETPPAGDRHIRKLLAEYDRLRPAVELTEEQKAAARAEAEALIARVRPTD